MAAPLNPVSAPAGFDFAAPAELFLAKRLRGRGRMGYRRFASAARAVGFVMEDLAAPDRVAAVIEVAEARFGSGAIRDLYDRADYPLRRHPPRQGHLASAAHRPN